MQQKFNNVPDKSSAFIFRDANSIMQSPRREPQTSLTCVFEDNISRWQTDIRFVVLELLLLLGQESCYILNLLLPNLIQVHSIV
jgi:hypothetical protein